MSTDPSIVSNATWLSAERDRNACREGSYNFVQGTIRAHYKTNFISLKPVLAFQTLTLATLGKWVTTQESVFFLCENCSWTLLSGSTWLQTLISWLYQLRSKLKNTFCFFKTCWWLTGLSRLYDACRPPGSYTRYFIRTMLKILVDRALTHHISFSFNWYFVWRLIDSRVAFHVTMADVNNLFPDLRFYKLWDLILILYTVNNLPVSCSTNTSRQRQIASVYHNKGVFCVC